MQALAALGVAVGGAGLGDRGSVARAQAKPATRLVLIVMDGFRPDYMSLAPMPALDALRLRGTMYDRAWVGQMESETPTGHAALGTGCFPRRNGVIGFEWRDPVTMREVLDGWPKGVIAGKLDQDLKTAGAPSIAQVVKARDPSAKVVSLSSEKVYAADAMGGWAADYILYHQRVPSNRRMLVPAAIPGHRPPDTFFTHPKLQITQPFQHFTDWDYLSTMLALAALEEVSPRVLMVNLPGPDVYGHNFGGIANPRVFKQIVGGIDRNIGRIVDAYKSAKLYQETLFVVTADHGMVPNSRMVEGATTKAAVRRAGGQYLFHTGGTAADIYLRNPTFAPVVAGEMAGVPNVAGAYYLVRDGTGYAYLRAPERPVDAGLDAAYGYLLSTFAGSTAPDVVAAFRENTIGSNYKTAHGDHGGLNWGAQHIPLILAGPGVRSGQVSPYPARLIDVAPTALRLLGLSPAGMDGAVLADACVAPTAAELQAQSTAMPALLAYQSALIGQSQSNIAEDESTQIGPPPSGPETP